MNISVMMEILPDEIVHQVVSYFHIIPGGKFVGMDIKFYDNSMETLQERSLSNYYGTIYGVA